MGERDILFTDGLLDDVIRLAARERRQPLTILDVNKMDSPMYQKQQATQFSEAPVRDALAEGRIQAFLEALLQTETGGARVAILDMPDGFRPFGHLVPDALLYRLETDFSDKDLAAVAAGQRVFQEKMERLAARRVPKGNPLHGYHRVLLAQASKLANNLGVMQAEAACLEDAAGSFRRALGMDPENLSARMNLMEVARRQGWPEWSTMEQDWPEWLNRGWSFRWALSMRYGYLWNAREWMKRGQAWAGSGMAMAVEGSRRREPVVDLREVERVQMIEQAYGQWGESEIDETQCRKRLLQNDRDRHALRALFILSLIRNDMEAAEAYLLEAAETGLDADLLAFDRAMLAYGREGREAAIHALKELVRENPSMDRGWLALALLSERPTATNRQAMKHLQNLPDGDVVFHTTVAWLRMAHGEWETARKVLEAAVHIQPRDRMTWEWMYILGQVQGSDRLVQTSRQTLVSGKPGHPLQVIQDLFPLIRDRNWEAVESVLREALRKERHPELLNALGNLVAERGGNVSEAVAMVEEALVRQPFNPRFRCARAELMRKAGNMEEAIRDVQSVLELLPGDPLALLMMAEYQLGRGQRDQVDECMRALEARESSLSPEHRFRMRMLRKAIQP